MDVEVEIASLKNLSAQLSGRVTSLEADLAALSQRRSPASTAEILPSEAVKEFERRWIDYQSTAEQISRLRTPVGPDFSPSKTDLDLANSLTIQQRTNWERLVELSKSLPATHAQWREVVEAIAKRGTPTGMIGVRFNPPMSK